VGEAAAGLADLVVVVGERANGIAAGVTSRGGVVVGVADRAEALRALQERLEPGDAVLVKASRGVALEWIVESLVGSARSAIADSVAAGGSRPSGRASEEIV
jgi:UDP-N-acetylmuramoyl-tripeptide--D-alanyl-D-alanine ligase